MKKQLTKAGLLAAGLFCATHALAGWTDVADANEVRAVQARATFHGVDVYGHRFATDFEQDGTATVTVGGTSMTAPWHLAAGGQLCIGFQEGTECYRVQKNGGSEYRTVHLRDGQEMPVIARGSDVTLSALNR